MRKGQKAPSYVKKKLSDACTEEKRKLISEGVGTQDEIEKYPTIFIGVKNNDRIY